MISSKKINKSKRWSEKEFETLRKLYRKGMEAMEISDNMGRTYHSVSKKISLLGLAKERALGATPKRVEISTVIAPAGRGIPRIESMVEKVKAKAKASGYSVVDESNGEVTVAKTEKETKVKDKAKAKAKASGYSVVDESNGEVTVAKTGKETKVKDKAKAMTKVARQIARANGKRITMAMFFVEDF
jgi:hypothetical protein